MTIGEAIAQVKATCPNNFNNTELKHWLSTVEGFVKTEIIDKHEGSEKVIFNGFSKDTPDDTELIVKNPYDELYVKFLEAQINYSLNEFDRYNVAMSLYNNYFNSYGIWYKQNHMPKQKAIKYY